jgi:CubicO group peptidase (beta-lactamase class C family)
MVAKGMIHWHTTIGEVFPELRQRMHPAYESVTIEQLLQHRGGVPGTADPGAWSTAWQRKGTVQEQRYEFVASTLSLPPANTPGTSVEYSNQGTTIVAAMLERVCGKDWETLNLEEVCKPLGIKSVGYGVPGDLQAFIPDQPWGHQRVGPSSSPSSGDNPPAIGPAAYIHISADDFARWMIVHLEGHNGKFSDFMPQETWRALHTAPPGSNPYYYTHALGWLATESLITHDGSNGLWWCRMWGSTLSKDALIICANSTTTPAVADSIAAEIKQQVLGLVG